MKALTNYYFRKKSMLGEWIAKKSCLANDYPLWVRQQKLDLCLHKDSKILDVGCGKGQFLMNMRAYGFTNLQGIDPFLDADIFYDNGVRIHKKNLEQLEEQFDFIMLNHSFEHMPDPLPTLLKIRKILKPNHYLLIRIPVSQSYQWSRYGLNWVSLDAPRHLYLHSRDSMALLAQQSGFRVAETIFDADGFSDWASVQYEAGIPLMDPRSYYVNRSDSIFKPEEIERFAEFAGELNAKGTADYAGFYLQ
ncbi:MAG TPA: class I SAM-dependent methyltransferase [Pyrinomonadaceae bacterium]|nr:class I SAM-dependent methyltransferase [Pyrinomonadaceae bacterium]